MWLTEFQQDPSGCPAGDRWFATRIKTEASGGNLGKGNTGLTGHSLSQGSTLAAAPYSASLCGRERQEAPPSPCPVTAALCLPTAGEVHPEEFEVKPGAGRTAHSPEPDKHGASTRRRRREPDCGSDPQVDFCGGPGNRRATRGLPFSATVPVRPEVPWPPLSDDTSTEPVILL